MVEEVEVEEEVMVLLVVEKNGKEEGGDRANLSPFDALSRKGEVPFTGHRVLQLLRHRYELMHVTKAVRI